MKFNLPGGVEILRDEPKPTQKKPVDVPTVEEDLPVEDLPQVKKRGRPKKAVDDVES